MTEKTTTISITGMTCAACANRIEKGLKKTDGVIDANVNLALQKSTIAYDPDRVDRSQLIEKIRALGYDVATKRLEFHVKGMSCAACANRIEKTLKKLDGIEQASVNLALATASVTYEPDLITPERMKKAVEKIGFSLEEKDGHRQLRDFREEEIQTLRKKFLFSLLLSFPLLWTMVSHFSWTSFIWLPDFLLNPWVQFALATPVQFVIGKTFYVGAYKALKNKSANMDVLVALGTSAAYVYSVVLSIVAMANGGKDVALYYETSAILITLIILGKLLEAKAKGRSSEAIKKLIGLRAKDALVIRDGKEKRIPLEEVVRGDIVVVKPGEKVPVDGVIIEGETALDESMITGESIPVDKTVGDEVIGATINKNGFIKVRATNVGEDAALAQIIKVVEEAQGSKAPIQRLADVISGIFVPIVVGLATLTFFVWFVFIDPGAFAVALEKFIAVLVIACPCALGLATPTSIMAGSGRAAEFGILFKGGEHLERTGKIDTVIFDKTGTVTKGQPSLTDVIVAKGVEEKAFLSLVATAESRSEHPLAEAIVAGAKKRGIPLASLTTFQAIPGHGVEAVVNEKHVLIGTRRLMNQRAIDVKMALAEMEALERDGKTAMLVAIDGEYAGIIAVADTVKETSKEAVSRLQRLGIDVLMITGDNERTAKAIAKQVNIETVIAEVLPEGKAEEIRKLQRAGKQVAMVGDGINDAPALAVADIGMAIGTGTDVAIETADITLIGGDLTSVYDAISISKKTMKNIKQNLFWALFYNSIGIPIAAAGFLAPWLAGAAMAFSSVSVVFNALRLQKIKPGNEKSFGR